MQRPRHSGIYHARRGGEHLRRNVAVTCAFLAVLVLGWVGFAVFRAIPPPQLVLTIPASQTIRGTPLLLRPPVGAQEAVAIEGIGTINEVGGDAPVPIASLTKMMSALVVLRDHPLALGANGPTITVTRADVASYRLEAAQGDSVVKVQAGEQLSELQALEGTLVPSGDNIVQLLATWDAGSTSAFVKKMNALARRLGMDHTHYAGPSGVNPATVSTASDQLSVAAAAMANPLFASIVSMPQVTLPMAGVQYNVDADLGSDGIDGIKTGWVPQGGGCFVFAATDVFHGRTVSVLGDVLGEQGTTPIPSALSAAKRLVLAAEATLHVFHLSPGSTVATLSAPYEPPIPVVTTSRISLVDWAGARLRLTATITTLVVGAPAGLRVGKLTVRLGLARSFAELTTRTRASDPSVGWRLTHL